MDLKVDANISFMFKEWTNFIDRYKAASEAGFAGTANQDFIRFAGFKAIECADEIFEYSIEELIKAKSEANVQQIVIVGYGGARGGLAALPGKETEFRQSFAKSVKYALALECERIHVCSGITSTDGQQQSYSSCEETYIKNLRFCSEEVKKLGIKILIEPITTIPGYFLTNTAQAKIILEKLNCDNVKMEFDFFHAQRTHGNLTETLKENLKYIGHIQVSQVPDRNEPSSAGEISYQYIFKLLNDLGYNQWIGCEYTPQGRTEDGLKWIKNFGLNF